VPLGQAVGRVAAEEVEVYPPGIPVILEGFRVSEDGAERRGGARQRREAARSLGGDRR
jgi:arginine/lysine/ornithine decarboxylase